MAIALTVKSRRERSVSSESENVTVGLRLSGRYTSARKVVISTRISPWAAPIVPKACPCSHTWSAHGRTSSRIRSGRASVVRS